MVYRFNSILKNAPWGGMRLCRIKGMDLSAQAVGESWELSDIKGMETSVASGEEAGTPLSELIRRHGASLQGSRVAECFGSRFPVLLKFLDSRQWLSVQVHPDSPTARMIEGSEAMGKSEMWYVIDAEPGAKLILGLKPGVTPADYHAAEGSDSVMNLVNFVDVEPGMTFLIPAGTIHALGPGCLVAEVQQPSDLTYRVYDYGRPRELHLEKARRAINFGDRRPNLPFKVEKHTLTAGTSITTAPREGTFMALMIVGGSCEIDGETFAMGTTALVSADHGPLEVRSADGACYLEVSAAEADA